MLRLLKGDCWYYLTADGTLQPEFRRAFMYTTAAERDQVQRILLHNAAINTFDAAQLQPLDL